MSLPQTFATVALVATGSLAALSGPTAAEAVVPTPTGDVCAGQTAHQNLSGAKTTVLANQPVRSGPAAGCNVRFNGQVKVDVHCYRISNGNVWWFVDTNLDEYVTDQQGWVFEGNLSSAPSRNQTGCQGPEF